MVSLQTHERITHRRLKKFKCGKCAYVANEKPRLLLHIACIHEKRKDNKCEQCDFITFDKRTLVRHVDALHSKISGITCKKCSFVPEDQHDLNQHMKEAHRPKYKCDLCEHRASRKKNLVSHMQRVHEKRRDHKCTL